VRRTPHKPGLPGTPRRSLAGYINGQYCDALLAAACSFYFWTRTNLSLGVFCRVALFWANSSLRWNLWRGDGRKEVLAGLFDSAMYLFLGWARYGGCHRYRWLFDFRAEPDGQANVFVTFTRFCAVAANGWPRVGAILDGMGMAVG